MVLWLLTIRVIIPGNPLLEKLKLQFESYIQNTPQEKIYLHIDKHQTTLGETIWFKVYLADARSHVEDGASSLVYVDLIDPKNRILDTKQLSTSWEMATGDFEIPQDSMPGNYTIRAYTNCMRNFDESYFYRQQIQVWDPSTAENSELLNSPSTLDDSMGNLIDTIHAHFFPEGGDLVNGLSSKVAFKITGSYGKSREAKMKIVDQQGKYITQAASVGEGMGFFILKPEPNRSYYGEIETNGVISRFALPQALKEGFALGVSQKPNGNPTIFIQTNIKNGLNGAFAIGQMMGQICFTIEGQPNVSEMTAQLPIGELPDGVCQFTLFNSQGEPVCERLIFIRNQQNEIHVDLRTNATSYNARQRVNIELDIKNLKSESLSANISCSIVDLTAIGNNELENNIQSYFLLSSDLPGLSGHPAYFLDSADTKHRLLLDLLMMTQGWRRFVWKSLPEADFKPKWKYLPERGFTISGYTMHEENVTKPVKAQIFLTAMGIEGFQMMDQVTAPDGGFHFADMNFADTTSVVLQANIYNPKKDSKKQGGKNKNEKIGPGGNRYVSIILNKEIPPKNNIFQSMPLPASFPDEYIEDRQNVYRMDSSLSGDWSVNLKEFRVKGRRAAKPIKEDPFASQFGKPTDRVVLDSLIGLGAYITLFDVLKGRVAGVQIHRNIFGQYATLRGPRSLSAGGDNGAQIYLDGMAIDNEQATMISVSDIAAIDVFMGTQANMFRGKGANGAILVHTRSRTGIQRPVIENTHGIIKFKHPGYYKAREFYSPDYSTSRPEHQKPDFRTTLYWQPYISQDTSGKYVFSFFTGDKKSDYRVIVEGITGDGRLIHKEAAIKVN